MALEDRIEERIVDLERGRTAVEKTIIILPSNNRDFRTSPEYAAIVACVLEFVDEKFGPDDRAELARRLTALEGK